jgi:hypothetical protein
VKNVFILHLLPLEYYPPITNLLDILAKERTIKTQVYSTLNNKNRKAYVNKKISVFRGHYPAFAKNKFAKLFAYFSTHVKPLWYLIKNRPDALMYFEPHSALPAYLYKRFINPKVKLIIHHHEYYAPQDFNGPSMTLVRYFHQLEKKYLFRKAIWISQTNNERLRLFKSDYPVIDKDVLHTLANYPPQHWQNRIGEKNTAKRLRLLYIGSISFENTYIKEIINFVKRNKTKVSLTIYAYNTSQILTEFLNKQDKEVINFYPEGITYEKIPDVASNYDIGLVLYNGHNLNYIYNAPNKLFEYLACGLDVWLPEVMEGCKPYLNTESRPLVNAIDFTNLKLGLIEAHQKSLTLPYRNIPYHCETELQPLTTLLKQ